MPLEALDLDFLQNALGQASCKSCGVLLEANREPWSGEAKEVLRTPAKSIKASQATDTMTRPRHAARAATSEPVVNSKADIHLKESGAKA